VISRGLIPTARRSSVVRAPQHFDLSRWLPKRPQCWRDRGISAEMPYAVTYLAHRLTGELSDAWAYVFTEYYFFLVAGWMRTFMKDMILVWMDEAAIKRMSELELDRMSDGPGGQAMLSNYHQLVEAMDVFAWTLVVKDTVRRDAQSRAAHQVRIQVEGSATYGFVLSHPCRGLDWCPAPCCGLTPSGLPMVGGRGGQGGSGVRGSGREGAGPIHPDLWTLAVTSRGDASARALD